MGWNSVHEVSAGEQEMEEPKMQVVDLSKMLRRIAQYR